MTPEIKIETKYKLNTKQLAEVLAKALGAPEGAISVKEISRTESDGFRDSWQVFDGVELIVVQTKK